MKSTKLDERASVMLWIRLTPSEVKRLDEMAGVAAERSGMRTTRSGYARKLVMDALKRKSKK